MWHIEHRTFNPFQENTYVLHNGSQAIIIDPGCSNAEEQRELVELLAEKKLEPARLLNTHAHIDHVLGNAFVAEKYSLGLELHELDMPLLKAQVQIAQMYGINYDPSPEPASFLKEGDTITLGDDEMEVLFVPGHAPGHVAFYCAAQKFVIGGDVLFQRSIGRTDLPGGDMDALLKSIREKLMTLPDDVVVHSGHGPSTTIGEERRENPFLKG